MHRKIVVCCPGDSVSGGPELLHQLVYELRQRGQDATICYLPRKRGGYATPKPYLDYQAPQSGLIDEPGGLIVFPETMTRYARMIWRADVAVWWLSIDNYYRKAYVSPRADWWRHFFDVIKGKQTIRGLRKYGHFVQSAYARDHLAKYGIKAEMLTDYLGHDHLAEVEEDAAREDIIAYNPKKGAELTQRLMAENPDLKFVPIQNMTSAEVRDLLHRAKLYIDFGHHPGKDRFPREAAMAGCCVVTGRRGAARFAEDVPIPEKYKLDDTSDAYVRAFRPLVDDIFARFPEATQDFETYRQRIRQEPEVFRAQAREIFL